MALSEEHAAEFDDLLNATRFSGHSMRLTFGDNDETAIVLTTSDDDWVATVEHKGESVSMPDGTFAILAQAFPAMQTILLGGEG